MDICFSAFPSLSSFLASRATSCPRLRLTSQLATGALLRSFQKKSQCQRNQTEIQQRTCRSFVLRSASAQIFMNYDFLKKATRFNACGRRNPDAPHNTQQATLGALRQLLLRKKAKAHSDFLPTWSQRHTRRALRNCSMRQGKSEQDRCNTIHVSAVRV